MHQKIIPTPTSTEYTVKHDDLIVNKTDLNGKITYGNNTFLKISCFDEISILGRSYGIIRHPDTPKSIYKLLYATLTKGDEFVGIVKNICSDGGFYWVMANVTPSYDVNGKAIGYFSVYRQPTKEGVEVFSQLYERMILEENSNRDSLPLLTDFIQKKGSSYSEYVISFT